MRVTRGILSDQPNGVVLSRRNLEALLAKLDEPDSAKTLLAPAAQGFFMVSAEENDVHYPDRPAGVMHQREEVRISKPQTGVS